MRHLHLAALALLLGLAPAPAAARAPDAPAERHQALRQEGERCYRQRDYRCALARFEAAMAIRATAEMRFNLASAQDKLGLHALAVREFRRYMGEAGSGAPPRALLHIQRRLGVLLPRVARLRLDLAPADAQLRLNGVPLSLDHAPLVQGARELVLEPGKYALELSAPGHAPDSRTVTMVAGEARTLEIALARSTAEPGALVVDSRPPGARVWVDGSEMPQRTPARFAAVAPGWHSVHIATETAAHRTRVKVSPGTEAELQAELEPVSVALEVTSEPPGARATLDGRDVGLTPLTVPAVPGGEHTLALSREGYRPIEHPLSITGWSPRKVAVALRLTPGPGRPRRTLDEALPPVITAELPIETAALRTGAAFFLGVADGDVTAYNFGVEGSYLLGDRLSLGLMVPLLVHGLAVDDGQVAEVTDFGNLVLKARVLVLGGGPESRVGLAPYLHVMLPTTSVGVPDREYIGLRPGAALTAQLGRLTLTGDVGAVGILVGGRDTWMLSGGAHGAWRLHRLVALGLALQLGAYLRPILLDEPAVSVTPQVIVTPWRDLWLTLGARIACTDVGKVYASYGRGMFVMSAGYKF